MNTSIIGATLADPEYVDIVNRWQSEFRKWDVRLTYKGRQIEVDYFMGIKRYDEPTAQDVIWSLIADDQTLQAGATFEDWCSELGYNIDSITDRATYDLCIENSKKIRFLYGTDFEAAQLEAEEL